MTDEKPKVAGQKEEKGVTPQPSSQPQPQAQPPTQEKKKSNWWKWLRLGCGILLLLAFLAIGGCVAWGWKKVKDAQKELEKAQQQIEEQKPDLKEKLEETSEKLKEVKEELEKEQEEATKEEAKKKIDPCDFLKNIPLKKTTKYGIFGDDTFDTVVCGYVKLQKETVFEETQTNVYFVITKFMDEGFKNSIEKGIAEGNTVNKKIDGNYAFNLGCLKDGKIAGIEYNPGELYMDEMTQGKILASTKENPLSLILSFGEHEGMDCACCNLAHRARLY